MSVECHSVTQSAGIMGGLAPQDGHAGFKWDVHNGKDVEEDTPLWTPHLLPSSLIGPIMLGSFDVMMSWLGWRGPP